MKGAQKKESERIAGPLDFPGFLFICVYIHIYICSFFAMSKEFAKSNAISSAST